MCFLVHPQNGFNCLILKEDVFLVHPQNGFNGLILNSCIGGCWFTPASFLEFIWIFSGRNHLKNQYLPHFESKSYQINSIKILLIKIFATTSKAHSNSSSIFSYDLIWFSVKKPFNIQELLHCKSERHGTKAHAPLLVESFPFQRDQECDLKASWFGGSHRYKTNKLPSFIDRFL